MSRTARGLGIGMLALALGPVCPGVRAEPGTPPAPVDARPPAARDLAPAGVPVQARLAEIQRRVQAALRYPAAARARGVEGESRVGFEVLPDGGVSRVTLLESSGSTALDRAAQEAVRAAGADGGLPPVLGRVAIPVRFRLAGPESD